MSDNNSALSFTTCEQYRGYMTGSPDNDSTVRHNPVPEDALSLRDLGLMSREEVLRIINEMGSVDNKSDIRVMYCHGYGFSWTQLINVAEFLNFKCETPGQRKAVYSDPYSKDDDDPALSPDKLVINYDGRYETERKLFISKETAKQLSTLTSGKDGKPYSNSVKSRILSALCEQAIAENYRKKRNGELSIVVKEHEI